MKYEGIVYRPPSEARSLILQVTIGCAHNQCTFCSMYKDKQFRIRGLEEIKAEISEVHAQYGDRIRRIFLADGNALVIPTGTLTEILRELRKRFPSAERITSYGAPKDVLRKSDEELQSLRHAGLEMVYLGLESGDDEILSYVKKGASARQIIQAGQKLKAAGIKTSITLISGLGGKARLEEHAVNSAQAVSRMKPDYLGFLTLMTEPGAPIVSDIETGKLQLLTPEEVTREMELFLSHVDSEGTVFRTNHASNYLSLSGTLNKDIPQMLAQVRAARQNRDFRRESWRSL